MEMDGGEGPNNSIETIEKYVNKHKFERCMGPNQSPECSFEFPSGHKIRIRKFIRDVQDQYGLPQKHKMKAQPPTKMKRAKLDESEEDEHIDIPSITK